MIQGTLPDSWGEEYKSDVYSLDECFSDKTISVISDALDFVLKSIERTKPYDYCRVRNEKLAFVDEIRKINIRYGAQRVKFVKGPHRKGLFSEMMAVCIARGYKGDCSYYG